MQPDPEHDAKACGPLCPHGYGAESRVTMAEVRDLDAGNFARGSGPTDLAWAPMYACQGRPGVDFNDIPAGR